MTASLRLPGARPAALFDWLYWGLAAAHVAVVMRLPVFPGQDGAVHSYYAGVFDSVWRDPSSYGGEYAIQRYLPPYAALNYLLVALQRLFSPENAEKLVVSACVLLLAGGMLYLARSVGGRTPVAALLIFPWMVSSSRMA